MVPRLILLKMNSMIAKLDHHSKRAGHKKRSPKRDYGKPKGDGRHYNKTRYKRGHFQVHHVNQESLRFVLGEQPTITDQSSAISKERHQKNH